MSVAFFTLPPMNVDYPYILINASNYKKQLSAIRKNRKIVRRVIIDSGVEIFRKPGVFEYFGGPREAIERQVEIFDIVSSIIGKNRVLVTVPDYPDDYKPFGLWISENVTNIERTYYNVLEALDDFPDVNWLIPIQGHNEDPDSLKISIKLYEFAGVLKSNQHFAVANLSGRRNKKMTLRVLKIARNYLKNKYIHSFGIRMLEAAEAGANGLINSFDTMAWTRPTKLAQLLIGAEKRWSCKNSWERVVYFYSWLLTITIKYGLRLEQVEPSFIIERLRGLNIDYDKLIIFAKADPRSDISVKLGRIIESTKEVLDIPVILEPKIEL